ncbi:MAG: nitroreductase family protein [Coriobacteriia bacterium]|nr:nitroreductase family protein [Coriobacteriia bacterium]
MEFYDAVASRRAVREFEPDQVDRAALERVVAAAASAPSSQNEQPWRFYVTTGTTREALGQVISQTTSYLDEYIDVLGAEGYDRAVRWYSSMGGAPVLIAVACPDSASEFQAANRLVSVGAAIDSLLLAATAEGLGACPITFSYWVRDEAADLLGIPEGDSVVSVIAIGTPAQNLPPRVGKRSDVAVWCD